MTAGYAATMTDALRVLREADLRDICERRGVVLLTAFGSAVAGGRAPRDLDLGVLFARSVAEADLLGLLDDLVQLTGYDRIDMVHLNRAGPVIRERALVGSVVLYEAAAGVWANASIAAMMERMDTDWLRRLALEAMAG